MAKIEFINNPDGTTTANVILEEKDGQVVDVMPIYDENGQLIRVECITERAQQLAIKRFERISENIEQYKKQMPILRDFYIKLLTTKSNFTYDELKNKNIIWLKKLVDRYVVDFDNADEVFTSTDL